jgi:hypothetical protein
MATIKELFMGEFKYGALASDITFSDGDGVTACKADARLYLAFEEYACFLAYFVSEEDATAQKLGILLHQYEDSLRADPLNHGSRCGELPALRRALNVAHKTPTYRCRDSV